jgi:hypothetical protein
MGKTLTKQADSKGRVTLGSAFAGKTLLIENIADGELRISVGKVIPASEAWLYANEDAIDSVRRGLQQARARDLVDGPDLSSAEDLANQIDED